MYHESRTFFVRGCVEIPVLNEEDPFIWNIWVSLSEENFHRMINLWESDEREHEPPYFGWFSVSIPGYPETLNLKQMCIQDLLERDLSLN